MCVHAPSAPSWPSHRPPAALVLSQRFVPVPFLLVPWKSVFNHFQGLQLWHQLVFPTSEKAVCPWVDFFSVGYCSRGSAWVNVGWPGCRATTAMLILATQNKPLCSFRREDKNLVAIGPRASPAPHLPSVCLCFIFALPSAWTIVALHSL